MENEDFLKKRHIKALALRLVIYLYRYKYVCCAQSHVMCSVGRMCLTLCDYSPPGSSVHEIFQARILEWGAISYSRGIFLTQGLHLSLWYLLHWQADSLPLAPPGKPPDINMDTCIYIYIHTQWTSLVA